MSAVIIDPKLVLISTLAVSQRILCLVTEVDGWRWSGGGVVRVWVAAHLESSRTPSIIHPTHPVMGDHIHIDNLSFWTLLVLKGAIGKAIPAKNQCKGM